MQKRFLFSGIAASLIAITGFAVAASLNFPDPPKAAAPVSGQATAVLAGGCFWGMQGIFEHVKGVTDTVVGYAGGKKETARYRGSKRAIRAMRNRLRSRTILHRSVMA